jgi:hypothetical protein
MMIEDGRSTYDTSEKIYNDLSDWKTQYGEVGMEELDM